MRYPLTLGRSIVMLLAVFGPAATSPAGAVVPVPFYNSHVFAIEKVGDGSVIIRTMDLPETVYAWYRKYLRDANGDSKIEDGGYILYTHSGTTIDIEPGDPTDRGTDIGIVWNAAKYGGYSPANRKGHVGPRGIDQ